MRPYFLLFSVTLLSIASARPQYDAVPESQARPPAPPPPDGAKIGVAGTGVKEIPEKPRKIFGDANMERAQEDLHEHSKPCAKSSETPPDASPSSEPAAPPTPTAPQPPAGPPTTQQPTQGHRLIRVVSPPSPPSKAELARFPKITNDVDEYDQDQLQAIEGSGEMTTVEGETGPPEVEGSGEMPSTSSSPASSTSTTSSSTVSEGSGEEPGPVEKKGDQFAAIITVGTSTTKQAETTVDEGSGEVEASGQEDTTTTQQYAPDTVVGSGVEATTVPEGSGATVDASNGYDQPELLLPATPKPEESAEKSGESTEAPLLGTTTDNGRFFGMAGADSSMDSEKKEVDELNKDVEQHMNASKIEDTTVAMPSTTEAEDTTTVPTTVASEPSTVTPAGTTEVEQSIEDSYEKPGPLEPIPDEASKISGDTGTTTPSEFETNGSVPSNEIIGQPPAPPTSATATTTHAPASPPAPEPKILPSGYEDGQGPAGPLQPDTKPIAVGYAGIPDDGPKRRSLAETPTQSDHFTSETTPIITIATTKKASGWKPFVFDCAKEEDDRGMLCQDWADSGLCERHKPTQFLFCRKTCLCTGPPNRRKRIN